MNILSVYFKGCMKDGKQASVRADGSLSDWFAMEKAFRQHAFCLQFHLTAIRYT